MSALEGVRPLSAGGAAQALRRFLRSRQSVSGALHGGSSGAQRALGPPLPDETLSQLEIVHAELAHQARAAEAAAAAAAGEATGARARAGAGAAATPTPAPR